MATTNFTGSLNTNKWFNNLYNAYLLVTTLADNLAGMDNGLATRFKADADLYHDKYVYTDTDILQVVDYDINDSNVLASEQRGTVKQQEITLDTPKQVRFTSGPWLRKKIWQEAGSFSQFESVLLGQIGNTRRLYEYLMVNTQVGAVLESNVGKQNLTVTLPTTTGQTVAGDTTTTYTMTEDLNRLQGQTISQFMADLFVQLKDASTDYNDNGFWKAYNSGDLLVIWNAEFKNRLLKIDMPTIFHNNGLEADFDGITLPQKYFGKVNGTNITATGANNTTIRALNEMEVTDKSNVKHWVKIGQLIPNNVDLVKTGAIVVPSYTEDNSIICKVVAKDGVKYLSTIQVDTEFVNGKNLTQNKYSTFEFAKPQYLAGKPMITIRKA